MTVFIRNLQRRFKIDSPLLRRFTTAVLLRVGAHEDTIGIILVNDQRMAQFNENFHHSAGPTDILTFPYPELAGGELIISVERAVAQAKRFRTTPSRELALYIVHGILHLHGHDDRTPRKRKRMRAAERCLLRHVCASLPLRSLIR